MSVSQGRNCWPWENSAGRLRLLVVLSEAEVRAVRQQLEGEPALVVGLLYGSGLRLMEALRLWSSVPWSGVTREEQPRRSRG